jgi:signal transduction histidine kinase
MKKFKIAFWILLLGFIGLIIGQNQGLFLAKQRLQLNLYVTDPLYTPELHTAVFFIAFFLLGLLVAYFFSLLERFKSRKTVKALNAAAAQQAEELSGLKAEIAELKNPSSPETPGTDASPEAESIPESTKEAAPPAEAAS